MQYIIVGSHGFTGESWVAQLKGRSVWYHNERVMEARDALQAAQSDPNVTYTVYKEYDS